MKKGSSTEVRIENEVNNYYKLFYLCKLSLIKFYEEKNIYKNNFNLNFLYEK